jgi:hypothetical protein
MTANEHRYTATRLDEVFKRLTAIKDCLSDQGELDGESDTLVKAIDGVAYDANHLRLTLQEVARRDCPTEIIDYFGGRYLDNAAFTGEGDFVDAFERLGWNTWPVQPKERASWLASIGHGIRRAILLFRRTGGWVAAGLGAIVR